MFEEFPVCPPKNPSTYSTSEMSHRSGAVGVGVCAVKTQRALLGVTHSDARFSMLRTQHGFVNRMNFRELCSRKRAALRPHQPPPPPATAPAASPWLRTLSARSADFS